MAASRVRAPREASPRPHLIYKSGPFSHFPAFPHPSRAPVVLNAPAVLVAVVQADPDPIALVAPAPSSKRPALAPLLSFSFAVDCKDIPPLPTTAMSTYVSDDIVPGDIVAVQHSISGRREGLVVGSHVDYAGRQIVEVQLEPGEIYHAWYPTVTRVRRTIQYTRPAPAHKRTIERTIYW
ncbi:hypothetical protein C8Q79DRAFT_943353 [Trametes meyenii]|nr:hypothetical protein C8Q79DRAFT_943353 [Trametes meyenii]